MKIVTITEPQAGMNTYVILENGHCLMIDPVVSSELTQVTTGIRADYAILTHEHYDHIRGVNDIRETFPDIVVLCGQKAKRGLGDSTINLSRYIEYINDVLPFGNGTAKSCNYSCRADQTVNDQQQINWEGHLLFFKETPGHSAGSISILMDEKHLFSGDVLFRDYPTATRLPGGSKKSFNSITIPWIEGLSGSTMVYPGHTEAFLLSERYPY